MVWLGLPGKSMLKRAKTVSTVVILPKPQLRCMQYPLVVSCVSGSTCCRSSLPAATSFSNSSFINISYFSRPTVTMALLKDVSEQKPRQIAMRLLLRRQAGGDYTRKPAGTRTGAARAFRGRTAGSCQELVYGVARWQLTLDWLIARKTAAGGRRSRRCACCCNWGFTRCSGCDRIPEPRGGA